MTISVIIATKFRHQDLLNTLENISLQALLPNELIIVDQNISSDIKNAVFSMFNRLDKFKKNNIILKYIHDSQITGLTQARNRGIEKNESDIVLFLDDDVILEKDFIFNILEIYRKYPEIAGVGGFITNFVTGYNMGLVSKIFLKIFHLGYFADSRIPIYINPKYKDTEYVTTSKLFGGLSSFRKEIFQEFKFDENFIGYSILDDVDFSFRVSRKYKIVIAPKARLMHIKSDVGRIDYKKYAEAIIYQTHYFFKKNLDKNIYNYICFIWFNIGSVVRAMLSLIFKQNPKGIVGTCKGLKKIICREDSDFLPFYKKK